MTRPILRLGLALVAAIACAGYAAAQPVGPSEPQMTGRMFDIPSARAWEIVRARLAELGFTWDVIDPEHRIVVTRWRDPDDHGWSWLPKIPSTSPSYSVKWVVYEVYVSPFVEPARVYVGSKVDWAKRRHSKSLLPVFNLPEVDEALMDQLASALGQRGVAIPADPSDRRTATHATTVGLTDPCSERWSAPAGAKVEQARMIRWGLSRLAGSEPRKAGKEARLIKARGVILEDGTIGGLHLTSPPRGDLFEASVLGEQSLMIYKPGMFDGCPVAITLRFQFTSHGQR